MDQGLRNYLGVPDHVKIYLDNGAFYFISHHGETPVEEYTDNPTGFRFLKTLFPHLKCL